MLIDAFGNKAKYYALHPDFEKTLQHLEKIFLAFGTGGSPTDPGQVPTSFQLDAPLRSNNCLYELHQQHIDIHVCLKGIERIAYAAQCSRIELSDDKNDFVLADGICSGEFVLTPGMFAVFFENELHKPNLGDTDQLVSKAVVKIAVND